MVTTFSTLIDGTKFDFNSLDASRPRLFQVYVMYKGERVRFHIQENLEGRFVIPMKQEFCPESYWSFEEKFENAIKEQYNLS